MSKDGDFKDSFYFKYKNVCNTHFNKSNVFFMQSANVERKGDKN